MTPRSASRDRSSDYPVVTHRISHLYKPRLSVSTQTCHRARASGGTPTPLITLTTRMPTSLLGLLQSFWNRLHELGQRASP
ncbi:hypothetical protein J6590_029974 [Homalodisca vitripennis]|nr:hypothetical protein J6590_029974 [Homalodisca vitripennis]